MEAESFRRHFHLLWILTWKTRLLHRAIWKAQILSIPKLFWGVSQEFQEGLLHFEISPSLQWGE